MPAIDRPLSACRYGRQGLGDGGAYLEWQRWCVLVQRLCWYANFNTNANLVLNFLLNMQR